MKNIEKEVRIHLHDAFKTKIAPVPRTRPYFNEELDRKVIVMNVNLNQYTLSLSFPMVIDTFSVKEYIILEFISFMLSGAGLYSLLMYELRQKRSLVYNVGAYNDCMKYLSLFKINIATTQHDTVQIIDVVLNTINNLKTGSVVSKKLKFFKKSFESAMKLNLSNADYKCFLLGTIMFNSDNKIMINETDLMKVVKSITISDIAKNCKKIFHIDKMGIVAVGKYENPQIQANNILDSLKKWQNK